MFRLLTTVLVLLVGIWLPNAAPAAEMLYFRSDACLYCERWDDEVGEIFPKTDEGKVLTLRPVDVHSPQPEDISFVKGVVYTPTFVLIEDGREIGRIVGYGGDLFFWESMGGLMKGLEEFRTARLSGCPDEPKSGQNKYC